MPASTVEPVCRALVPWYRCVLGAFALPVAPVGNVECRDGRAVSVSHAVRRAGIAGAVQTWRASHRAEAPKGLVHRLAACHLGPPISLASALLPQNTPFTLTSTSLSPWHRQPTLPHSPSAIAIAIVHIRHFEFFVLPFSITSPSSPAFGQPNPVHSTPDGPILPASGHDSAPLTSQHSGADSDRCGQLARPSIRPVLYESRECQACISTRELAKAWAHTTVDERALPNASQALDGLSFLLPLPPSG